MSAWSDETPKTGPPHQPLEKPVCNAFGAEPSRQIVACGSVAQQPEQSVLRDSFIRARAAGHELDGNIPGPQPRPIHECGRKEWNDSTMRTSTTSLSGFGTGNAARQQVLRGRMQTISNKETTQTCRENEKTIVLILLGLLGIASAKADVNCGPVQDPCSSNPTKTFT